MDVMEKLVEVLKKCGVCIADENGNFFYPPELNYCPNCGAKMMPQPSKGE